ncbi:FAD-dependent thymidylate synthase [Candidatus Daviesbacteria bacterium]|nr:FAD-dependent thymidylate synthase [Candidatus Daviesbacteria bacterium]
MNELVERAKFYNPPIKEQLSFSGDPEEETAARVAIEHFVTDPDGPFYAFTPYVPELYAALIIARYSRTDLSARQLIWREFVAHKKDIPWEVIDGGMEALRVIFDYRRARSMAERVLNQYGDDSVYEMGGVKLFLNRVSQPAAKVIEDARIGISPIEKSTRFVAFDQKGPDGDYAFFKDPRIMDSDYRELYLESSRACFEVYARSFAALQNYFQKQIPIESQSFSDLSSDLEEKPQIPFGDLKDERSIRAARTAYRQSIRAKACDVARVLLPASTLTNIGESGNARAFGYLMTKMMAHPLAEMQMIASGATVQLKKVLPEFFEVIDNDKGEAYQTYLRQTEAALQRRAKELLTGIKPDESSRVELVKMDPNPEINIAAGLLYPYARLPLRQLIDILRGADPSIVGDILHDSLRLRTNRRHKPPRAFEISGYELVFDILGNFGIYRDLQRQRMLTQQRQAYTTEFGYDMPVEFEAIKLEREFAETMGKMGYAYNMVAPDFSEEAQYLTTLANYMRWYMGMDLREGIWVTELRSIPQGHFSYRTVAQDMAIQAQKIYPFLASLQQGSEQFVDMTNRRQNLERMEAMKRIQRKLAEIEERFS